MLATWPDLIRLHYIEENAAKTLDNEDDILLSAHKAIQGAESFTKNLKRNLNHMTRRHYNMKFQEDALNSNMKSLTRKLMKEPSIGPQAIGKILVNPDDPRNKEGDLLWRKSNSDVERLTGTAQQHTNWMGTENKEKACTTAQTSKTRKIELQDTTSTQTYPNQQMRKQESYYETKATSYLTTISKSSRMPITIE